MVREKQFPLLRTPQEIGLAGISGGVRIFAAVSGAVEEGPVAGRASETGIFAVFRGVGMAIAGPGVVEGTVSVSARASAATVCRSISWSVVFSKMLFDTKHEAIFTGPLDGRFL